MLQREAENDPPEVTGCLWQGVCGDRAFDVGSNCGQSMPFLLDKFRVVHGFEPAAESFAVLKQRYDSRAILHQVAVSDRDGEVILLESPLPLSMGQLVSAEHHANVGVNYPVRIVPSRTLDYIAAETGMPDFVKVDTEGHEEHVLRGAARLIGRPEVRWLIEFHSAALYGACVLMLQQGGHEVLTIRHPHYPQGAENWHNHGWIKTLTR